MHAAQPQVPEEARQTGVLTAVPRGWLDRAQALLARADAQRGWVEVGQRQTTLCPEQWWHTMHAWTARRSFMRSIWRIDVEDALGALTPVPAVANAKVEEACGTSPPSRSWCLRRLQRKQPVHCHYGQEGDDGEYDATASLTVDMLEWAMHEVGSSAASIQRCVFGMVLPEALSSLQGYFPFTYPRSWMYAFTYAAAEGGKGRISFAAIPLEFQLFIPAGLTATEAAALPIVAAREMPQEHLEKGALKVLGMCHKWGVCHEPQGLAMAPEEAWAAGYDGPAPERRLPFDVLVPEVEFRIEYNRLKRIYGKDWVAKWPEQTDPQKFVYEEIAIAAYLLSVWRLEREKDPGGCALQTFCDVGCGNGFLTFLLIMEGHQGWGVDVFSRGLWNEYPPHVRACLEVCALEPGRWKAVVRAPVLEDEGIETGYSASSSSSEEEEGETAAEHEEMTEEQTVELFGELVGGGFFSDEEPDDEAAAAVGGMEDEGGSKQLLPANVAASASDPSSAVTGCGGATNVRESKPRTATRSSLRRPPAVTPAEDLTAVLGTASTAGDGACLSSCNVDTSTAFWRCVVIDLPSLF